MHLNNFWWIVDGHLSGCFFWFALNFVKVVHSEAVGMRNIIVMLEPPTETRCLISFLFDARQHHTRNSLEIKFFERKRN